MTVSADKGVPVAPIARRVRDQNDYSSSPCSPHKRSPLGQPLLRTDNYTCESSTPDNQTRLGGAVRSLNATLGPPKRLIPKPDDNKIVQSTLHLQDSFDKFVHVITETTSTSTLLESRMMTSLKELEVYKQWQRKTSAAGKSSELEKKELNRVKGEIDDIQNQMIQKESDRRVAGRHLVAALISFMSRQINSESIENTSEADVDTRRLGDENRSLKLALEKTNTALEMQENRLKALEDQQREQLNGKSVGDDGESETKKVLSDYKKDLKQLQEQSDEFRLQTTSELSQLREKVTQKNMLFSQLSAIEKRLVQCENGIDKCDNAQDLHRVDSLSHEMQVQYGKLTQEVENKANQLSSAFSAKFESLRARDNYSEIAQSVEEIRNEVKSLGNEMSNPVQGIRSQLSKLEERIQSTQNSCSETADAVQNNCQKKYDLENRVLEGIKTRMSSIENSLQQQTSALIETDQKSSKSLSDVQSQIENFRNGVESVQATIAELEQSILKAQTSTRSKDSSSSASNQHRSQRGWEVDEAGIPAPDASLGPVHDQELKQKVTTLESFVASHEQRLNHYTLEPFLRSIVHQMRIMYPYPDQLSRTVETLRVSNLQLTTQYSEVQNGLARVENQLKSKVTSMEILPEVLPQLNQVGEDINQIKQEFNQIEQDIFGLKASVGKLNSSSKEQAQELQKRSAERPNHAGLAQNGIGNPDNPVSTNGSSPNEVQPQKPSASPKSAAQDMNEVVLKLESFIGETNRRFEALHRRVFDVNERRKQNSSDLLEYIEALKKEYDKEFGVVHESIVQGQEDFEGSLERIREIEDNVVKHYGELQYDVTTLKRSQENSRFRTSSSPAQGSNSSAVRSLVRHGKQPQAQDGQGASKRPSKRKRVLSDSESDDGNARKSR